MFWRNSWFKNLAISLAETELCMNTWNNINFHYRTNSVEINYQIFFKIKKNTSFGPFSLWQFKSFSKKCDSATHNDWISFQPSCICTSMQKIRLFHLFSFEKQSILKSHDQTGHTHFWTCPPNKFLISFYLLWICINMLKISLFHLFILEIESILESHLMTGHIHFWLHQPLNFQHPLTCMNLYQHPKNKLILEIQ